MPRRRKGFIDKNNSVTFRLVHRSQQDPLIADESAPAHVLVPTGEKSQGNKRKVEHEDQKQKQRQFGIFFDDDYNYLQHLKTVSEVNVEWEPVERSQLRKTDRQPLPGTAETEEPLPNRAETEDAKLQLPSSVFESEYEEKVGMLNKAAPFSGPRPELDPDIVAAMDEDFDFDDPENMLEDDFIHRANATPDGSDAGLDAVYDIPFDDDEEYDDVGSLNGSQFTFSGEETRSRFTSYSLSSSVMRRSEQLTLLDDKFEKMFEEYDDSEIGALDCEEIGGRIQLDSDLLKMYASEFEKEREEVRQKDIAAKQVVLNQEGEENVDEVMEDIVVEESERWDCESIISRYSNIYNHPKLISEPAPIKVSKRSGVPVDVISSQGLTSSNLAQLDQETRDAEDVRSFLSTISFRSKDETPSQRAARKQAVREYRRERRLEKKANTRAFKEEKKKQELIIVNNHKNVQGFKML